MSASTANDPNISSIHVENYGTPFAYLHPELARDFALEGYIVFALVGVFALDFFSTLHHEIYIIIHRRIQWPLVAHYISRLSTMALVVTVAIGISMPVSDCKTWAIFLSATLVFSAASSSFQYFLRVRAVVCHWRVLTLALFALWLCICGCCFLIPFAISSHRIGPTKFCIPILEESWGSPLWFIITWAIFDTLTFLVVSYDLLVNLNTRFGHRDPWWKQSFSLLTGRYLPKLAKSFFRRGTKYYLTAVALDVAVLALAATGSPSLTGQPLTLALVFSDVCAKNMLICRLYRVTIVDASELSPQQVSLETVSPAQSKSNHEHGKDCLSEPADRMQLHAPVEVRLGEEVSSVTV